MLKGSSRRRAAGLGGNTGRVGARPTEMLDRLRDRRYLTLAAWLLLGAVAAWLVAAAALVDIEYYDGVSAICNARYFLARSPFYFFDRGPLMAWVLMPAEAIRDWLGLHPLEVRPHHATTALLHLGYLVAVYAALVRHAGPGWSTVLAVVTAVTSYMFASYAPFVSHDILVGALFLWMLIWSEDFASAPRARPWLLLVSAGALAALVKQTFGVVWIAVLVAHLLPTLLRRDPGDRTSARALWGLAAGAATSGLVVWLVYGVVLSGWAPDVPAWARPYRNLQYLAHVYDGTDVVFPPWIYIRNWWAYGRVTTLLLIPGLVLCLGGSRLQRRMALAWIAAVVFVHAMPLREVRYMAFVAPVSAFVIVPAMRMLGARAAGALLIAALLVLDVSGAVTEAARVGTAFHRHSEARAALEPLWNGGRPLRPLFHNVSMLSFVAPDGSPLAADRYHRIFHVSIAHVAILFGYAASEVRPVLPGQTTALSATAPEGSALLFASAILAHGPTWTPAPPIGGASFVQGLATARTIALRRRDGTVYEAATGEAVTISAETHGARTVLVVDPAGLSAMRPGYLFPVATIDNVGAFPLERRPDGYLVLGARGAPLPTTAPGAFAIRFFAPQRRTPPPAAGG